jgi:hypothetical protein
MNRRGFLKVLLASAALSHTLSAVAGAVIKPKPEQLSWHVSYDDLNEVTHLRVSYLMPDGREWHNMIRKLGDYTDQEGLSVMWRAHENTLTRALEGKGLHGRRTHQAPVA